MVLKIIGNKKKKDHWKQPLILQMENDGLERETDFTNVTQQCYDRPETRPWSLIISLSSLILHHTGFALDITKTRQGFMACLS